MSQEQSPIPLRLLDGRVQTAVRTGNNAAWLCPCQRREPLLGYSDERNSPRDYSEVICPSCRRAFRVVAPGLKKVPIHVEELRPLC
jgi:hypothetical protein